jgi:hypothetical protein
MAGTSAQRLHLTDSFIRAQVLQVAPAVTRLTGWNLGLDTLGCRVLPKDRGYEELLLSRLDEIGIHDWQDLLPGFLERMLEYLIEQNTLAAYLPGAGEILVIRENVDDSNLDGLRLVLGHELVHRGQHMAHGPLFARLEALLEQALAQIQSGAPDLEQVRQIAAQIQPIMTLLESHAAYVQGRLRQAYFPEARIESHFNLGTLLMRVIGAAKVAQYTDGLPQVAAAVASGRVELLYAGFED